MLLDLEVLSVQQFISGNPSGDLENCVGSTHFDGGTVMPDGSVAYVYQNLWLRYELSIPRKLKTFEWKADYRLALNGPEYVKGQRFGWSFGTEDAPSTPNGFYWDVDNNTSGLVSQELRVERGTAWFWLTYDFAGQNNCYVKDVNLSVVRGKTVGSMRVWNGVEFIEGTPHVAVNGQFLEGEAYIYRGGVWQPGN